MNHAHATSHQAADWRSAHQKLVELSQTHAALDFEEGEWLLAARRRHVHARLGYASFAEYVLRLFGYAPRFVREKLRVAEALVALPASSHALRTGQINWSVAREVTRVATPATEAEWLAAASSKTARQVEQMVSGLSPGSRPGDSSDPAKVRHVIRLDVSGEALALFREAMAKVRQEAGEPLDDDAAILLLARQVLEGRRDEGRASYQVAVTLCEHCQRGWQPGGGELVALSPEMVETACCDQQRLDDIAARAVQEIPPRIRRAVLRRDHGRCVVPGCRHTTFVDVHHLRLKSEGGTHDLENLVTLCSAHHRAAHRGLLWIERSDGEGCVRHADGTPYGAPLTPTAIDERAKAFSALRRLGFGEAEVRRALEATHMGHGVEAIVRSCLIELTAKFHAA